MPTTSKPFAAKKRVASAPIKPAEPVITAMVIRCARRHLWSQGSRSSLGQAELLRDGTSRGHSREYIVKPPVDGFTSGQRVPDPLGSPGISKVSGRGESPFPHGQIYGGLHDMVHCVDEGVPLIG